MHSRYPVVDPFELASELSSYLQTPGRTCTGWRPELGSPSSSSSFQRPRTGMPQEDVRCVRKMLKHLNTFDWMIHSTFSTSQSYNHCYFLSGNVWVGWCFYREKVGKEKTSSRLYTLMSLMGAIQKLQQEDLMGFASRCQNVQESLNNLASPKLSELLTDDQTFLKYKSDAAKKVFSSQPLDFNHCCWTSCLLYQNHARK